MRSIRTEHEGEQVSVAAVIGGQFGSEGKGLIVNHIAEDYAHHVRVGAANAGHTIYTSEPVYVDGIHERDDLRKHVMQQLPCAAYSNPEAVLLLGPGAMISPDILNRELDKLDRWRKERRLDPVRVYIDPRAHVITEEHVDREVASDLAERIGSTSTLAREGIGVAAAARLMRETSCVMARDFFGDEQPEDVPLPIHLRDVPEILSLSTSVLLEGTQGTGLSNTTGFFPYVTSRNTTAAGLCADAGISPLRLDEVIGVFRAYPIRVAGPSGPFYPDSTEIQWEDIDVDPGTELTTVTKKVRRVATFSWQQLFDAVVLNGITQVALTFMDYLDREIASHEGAWPKDQLRDGFPMVADFVDRVERETARPVTFLGTGPHSVIELVR